MHDRIRSAHRLAPLLLALVLSACASLPEDYPRTTSQAWPKPEDTTLGAWFDGVAPADDGVSGIRLIPEPRLAFITRYALANQAEHTLDLQYYLWKGDTTGGLLLHQALAAADRGVQVRILIDDIYHSGRDRLYATIDSHPAVQVRVFNPIAQRGLTRYLGFAVNKSKLNHRMHNKIFLVDNAVAVIGGRNIGDDYFGIDPDLNFQDLDVAVVGPAAQEAGTAYDMYWNSESAVPIDVLIDAPPGAESLRALRRELGEDLAAWLDELPYDVPLQGGELEAGLRALADGMTWAPAEVVVDPLERFTEKVESSFVDLTRRLSREAQEDVVVQTAYLIPSEEFIDTVDAMTDRGVRIRIMTNSMQSNNHLPVHAFYMKYRETLLNAGVDLYEYRPDSRLLEYYKQRENHIADSHSGLHTKAFVIDGRTSVVGSYNMDPRSRVWNSEIALMVESEAFAERVLEEMDEEFEPGNAYRLELDDGDIRWTAETEDGVETWTHDPGTSAWRRALARIIGWLPLENEL